MKKSKHSKEKKKPEKVDKNVTFVGRSSDESDELSIKEINKLLNLQIENRSIKRYKHIKTIRLGGVGVVLSAYEPELNREVAIKILRPPFRDKIDSLKHFVREARATAHIEHPNIVPVHQLGVFEDDGVFFSMKKVEGMDLRSVIEKLEAGDKEFLKKYTRRQLLQIFISILNGVAYAHSKGVIHCDLKPANIMLGDYGEVMVMDWGLVKYQSEKDNSEEEWLIELDPDFRRIGRDDVMNTVQGAVSGTPAYMSPEQAEGRTEELDEQSDIYSLGAILYSILTWKASPFESLTSTNEILNSVVNGDFKRPRKRSPKRLIPRDVEAICLKAMASRKKDRYRSVENFIRDIKNHLEGRTVLAYKRSFFVNFFKRIVHHPLIPSTIIAAILAGIGVFGIIRFKNESRLSKLRSFAKYNVEEGDWYYLAALNSYKKLKTEYKKMRGEMSQEDLNKLHGDFNRCKREFYSNYNIAAQFLFQAEDFGASSYLIDKELLEILQRQLTFASSTDNYDETREIIKQLRLRRHRVFARLISSKRKVYEQIKMIVREEGIIKLNSTPAGLKIYCKQKANKILLGSSPFSKKLPLGIYLLLLQTASGEEVRYPVDVLCGRTSSVDIYVPRKIPVDMCYIPAGTFCFGNQHGTKHICHNFLPSYFISRRAVTIEEYLEFWKSLKSPLKKNQYWARYLFSSGDFKNIKIWDDKGKLYKGFDLNMPVVGISAKAAETYCAWLGKKRGISLRLPSDLEWEKATRMFSGENFSKNESVYGLRDIVIGLREFATEKRAKKNIFVSKGGMLTHFSRQGYSNHSNGNGENNLGFRYVMPFTKQ